MLAPKCSPPPLPTKRVAVFEKFVSPQQKGVGEDTMKTLSQHFDQSPVFQPIKFLNLKINQINLFDQSVNCD